MKNFGKKCVLALAAMVIALGSVTMVTGCKKSEPSSPPPAPEANEHPEKAPAPPAQ